jgi:hypothetical protein
MVRVGKDHVTQVVDCGQRVARGGPEGARDALRALGTHKSVCAAFKVDGLDGFEFQLTDPESVVIA